MLANLIVNVYRAVDGELIGTAFTDQHGYYTVELSDSAAQWVEVVVSGRPIEADNYSTMLCDGLEGCGLDALNNQVAYGEAYVLNENFSLRGFAAIESEQTNQSNINIFTDLASVLVKDRQTEDGDLTTTVEEAVTSITELFNLPANIDTVNLINPNLLDQSLNKHGADAVHVAVLSTGLMTGVREAYALPVGEALTRLRAQFSQNEGGFYANLDEVELPELSLAQVFLAAERFILTLDDSFDTGALGAELSVQVMKFKQVDSGVVVRGQNSPTSGESSLTKAKAFIADIRSLTDGADGLQLEQNLAQSSTDLEAFNEMFNDDVEQMLSALGQSTTAIYEAMLAYYLDPQITSYENDYRGKSGPGRFSVLIQPGDSHTEAVVTIDGVIDQVAVELTASLALAGNSEGQPVTPDELEVLMADSLVGLGVNGTALANGLLSFNGASMKIARADLGVVARAEEETESCYADMGYKERLLFDELSADITVEISSVVNKVPSEFVGTLMFDGQAVGNTFYSWEGVELSDRDGFVPLDGIYLAIDRSSVELEGTWHHGEEAKTRVNLVLNTAGDGVFTCEFDEVSQETREYEAEYTNPYSPTFLIGFYFPLNGYDYGDTTIKFFDDPYNFFGETENNYLNMDFSLLLSSENSASEHKTETQLSGDRMGYQAGNITLSLDYLGKRLTVNSSVDMSEDSVSNVFITNQDNVQLNWLNLQEDGSDQADGVIYHDGVQQGTVEQFDSGFLIRYVDGFIENL